MCSIKNFMSITATFKSNVPEAFEQLWKEEYGSFWQHINCLNQWLNFIWLINETVAHMSLCLQSRTSLTSRETFKPFEPLQRQSVHFLRGWSTVNWTTMMIRKYPTERSRNNNKRECRLQLALTWSNWTVEFQISFVVQQTTATGKNQKTGLWDSFVKYSRVVNTCVKFPLKTPKNYS